MFQINGTASISDKNEHYLSGTSKVDPVSSSSISSPSKGSSRRKAKIMAKIMAIIGLIIGGVFLTALIIRAIGYSECSIQPWIPKWLVGFGVAGLVEAIIFIILVR